MTTRFLPIGLLFALVLVACSNASGVDENQPSSDARDAGSSSVTSDAGSIISSTTPTVDGGPSSCGQNGGQRGLSSRSVTVGGVKRTYLAYLPASLSATKPAPFVFAFHGYTESGQKMHDTTNYAALADSEGIALVFPDGEGGPDSILPPWNVENSGQSVCGLGQLENATGDDFDFMDAMKADVLRDQCIDSSHVYVTGFSMGGYFSHHVACYRNDVRAVAPHSGGTLASLTSCTTGHVPMIIFHGDADGTIASGCDDPNSAAQAGFPASATLWAEKNGCGKTFTAVPEVGTGGGAGQCYVYDACPSDGQVEVCTFTGMSHCWAGGDSCSTYASATQLEWSFFKKYAW